MHLATKLFISELVLFVFALLGHEILDAGSLRDNYPRVVEFIEKVFNLYVIWAAISLVPWAFYVIWWT